MPHLPERTVMVFRLVASAFASAPLPPPSMSLLSIKDLEPLVLRQKPDSVRALPD
jgi:hypothetical protein